MIGGNHCSNGTVFPVRYTYSTSGRASPMSHSSPTSADVRIHRPSETRQEATPEDLAHTLRCLSQTVAMLSGPQDTEVRFKSLESLANVCVFGKGHLFSVEQQVVYAGILELMRHNGRHDGQARPMTAQEQEKCAALWVKLLTLAAERMGAVRSSEV